MRKAERPTIEQYRELLEGLRPILKDARAMLIAFNDLDHHLRLPIVYERKLNSGAGYLREFIIKVEYAVRDTIRGADHYHPSVFQEQCGELVRELQKLVDEG